MAAATERLDSEIGGRAVAKVADAEDDDADPALFFDGTNAAADPRVMAATTAALLSFMIDLFTTRLDSFSYDSRRDGAVVALCLYTDDDLLARCFLNAPIVFSREHVRIQISRSLGSAGECMTVSIAGVNWRSLMTKSNSWAGDDDGR